MTFVFVICGVMLAGACAWMVNVLVPERYTTVASMDVAEPIHFESLPSGANLADLERGRAYYAQLCMSCHGARGDGQGEWAYRVKPRPGDLRSARSRARSEAQLYDIISEGLAGTAMIGWKARLSSTQLGQIVTYVRHLALSGRQQAADE